MDFSNRSRTQPRKDVQLEGAPGIGGVGVRPAGGFLLEPFLRDGAHGRAEVQDVLALHLVALDLGIHAGAQEPACIVAVCTGFLQTDIRVHAEAHPPVLLVEVEPENPQLRSVLPALQVETVGVPCAHDLIGVRFQRADVHVRQTCHQVATPCRW